MLRSKRSDFRRYLGDLGTVLITALCTIKIAYLVVISFLDVFSATIITG